MFSTKLNYFILISHMQKKIYCCTQSGIEIGATTDTPPLYFVIVQDLNKDLVYVPYRDHDITIEKLIYSYQQITSCKHHYKQHPSFIFLQGVWKSQLALPHLKLSSLDLRLYQPAFKVIDGKQVNQKLLSISHSNLAQSEKECKLEIRVLFNDKNFQISINRNEHVSTLKAKLLNNPQFQNISLDMIRLIFNSTVLLNSNRISEYKGLVNSCQLTAVVVKSEGCFRSNTMITLPNGEALPIDRFRVGDKILSYNERKRELEQDEITWIHKSTLSQYTLIVLEDDSIIETTPNHTFLCHDYQYRKVTCDRQQTCLKVGTKLKRYNSRDIQIKSIQQINIFPPQEFYHFVIKKNHNFIVNHLIAHNMFIRINYLDRHQDSLNVGGGTTIQQIKQELSQKYQLHVPHSMKILYNGLELASTWTLSDYNIKKQSKIMVSIKNDDEFNFIHPQTKIKVGGNFKMVKDIVTGDIVNFSHNNQSVNQRLDQINKKDKAQFYKITLESKEEIKLSGESYLELQNGEAKIVIELFESFKKEKNLSLKRLGGFVKVMKIQKIKKPNVPFCQLISNKFSSFFLEGNIIIHNKVINLVFLKDNIKYRLSYGIRSSTKVVEIKSKLAEKFQININKLHFYYNNQQLHNETTFDQHQIKIGTLIIIDVVVGRESVIFSNQRFEEQVSHKIELRMSSNQVYELQYSKFAQKTIQQIMRYLIPNYKSSFFFLFSNSILLPTQKLHEIQKSPAFNQQGSNTVIVVKNQKLAFIMNMNLKGTEAKNISFIGSQKASSISLIDLQFEQIQKSQPFKQTCKRIQNNAKLIPFHKQPIFYRPFLYLFDPDIRQQIRNYLRNFQCHLINKTKSQIFKIIKSLYINLIYLPNFITKPLEETYFGIRNFKFSSFFNKNDTFYLYDYLLATNDDAIIRSELQDQNGTLFHLISTTGKNIINFSINNPKTVSKVKNGKSFSTQYIELVFPPYTYFLVNKIVRTEQLDEVWISQIASPITLKKDIVLWVDDIPKNNEGGVNLMLKDKDLQVLPLLSTQQAEKWLNQFGWLMNWKGINFKLISDMGRLEYKQNAGEEVQDYQAGFQLVDKIYNKYGLTVKTYIFCGDKGKTQQLLNTNPKFHPLRDKYNEHFKITANGKEIIQFCCEDAWP